MSFWAELKRRNVFKVGAAYTLVAWLAIQIVNNFFPPLGLPEWSLSLVAFLIVLGFPFALVFAWIFEMTPEGIKPTAMVEPGTSRAGITGQRLNYAILGLLVLAVGFLLVDRYVFGGNRVDAVRADASTGPRPRSAGPGDSFTSVTRSLITVDPFDRRVSRDADDETRFRAVRAQLALSPDGRTLVINAQGDGGRQLYARALDRLEIAPLLGTAGARAPFFSPDGAWIGFHASGELRRIPTTGNPPSTILRLPAGAAVPVGISWGDDDQIVFEMGRALWRVPAGGGEPEQLTTPASDEFAHRLPHVLPGAKSVLFTVVKQSFRWDNARVVVRSLASGEQKPLLEDAADARYLPTGHLIFVRRGTLMAAAFDLARLEVAGDAVALVDDVMQAVNEGNPDRDSGAAQFAVAPTGTLVYATGGENRPRGSRLVWVDRSGAVEPVPGLPADRSYLAPRLSPDGTRIAVTTRYTPTVDTRLWTHELGRGGLDPVTAPEERSTFGVWTRDGARLAFQSDVGAGNLFWKPLGGGPSERLTTSGARQFPGSWTPNDQTLLFLHDDGDIWALDVAAPQRPASPVVATPATERQPALSYDGRWLAYTSNDSGRNEIYVQPFPGPGPRLSVSPDGGHSPVWKRDGTELYYQMNGNPVSSVMVVALNATTKAPGIPRELFSGEYATGIPVAFYDVTPQGDRFLMTQPVDSPPEPITQLVLVQNWLEEVRQRAPARR